MGTGSEVTVLITASATIMNATTGNMMQRIRIVPCVENSQVSGSTAVQGGKTDKNLLPTLTCISLIQVLTQYNSADPRRVHSGQVSSIAGGLRKLLRTLTIYTICGYSELF